MDTTDHPLCIFISHPSEMLTDCRPHGDGLIADRLIRNLAARGHQLHIAVERSELRDKYPSNVTLHKVTAGPAKPSALSRLQFALGVRHLLAHLSQTIHFDVVHQLNPVTTGLSLALWDTAVPLVLGPYVPDWPIGHGQVPEGSRTLRRVKTQVKRSVWQMQHKVASGIILSTLAALDKVDHPSEWESKLHVIPYGIDIEAFTPGPQPKQKTILFVGTIMAHKGVFVLLEAFRTIAQRIPECQLLLAGIGSGTDEAKQIAASIPMPENIHFLGKVERSQLPDLFRRCTVSCVPSFGEPFGLVALEAMACGRPVVGTDASGLAHLIPDEGGLRVPINNPEALAEALLTILEDEALARSMGIHNRKVVEEKYAWPAVITQLEGAYRLAMELKSASA